MTCERLVGIERSQMSDLLALVRGIKEMDALPAMRRRS